MGWQYDVAWSHCKISLDIGQEIHQVKFQIVILNIFIQRIGTGCRCPFLSYFASISSISISSPILHRYQRGRTPHTEKCIRKRDSVNLVHGWIIHKVRINEKKYRHIYRLPRIQPLLLKAETLNLAKIRRHLCRRHTVRSHAYNIFTAFVRGGVKGKSGFAR